MVTVVLTVVALALALAPVRALVLRGAVRMVARSIEDAEASRSAEVVDAAAAAATMAMATIMAVTEATDPTALGTALVLSVAGPRLPSQGAVRRRVPAKARA